MTHCCSQCSFTAQFQSALTMHHQLHHESIHIDDKEETPRLIQKSCTVPRTLSKSKMFSDFRESKGLKLAGRVTSATRLFDKLRARICRSRCLISHTEEDGKLPNINDLSVPSECTSKALNVDSALLRSDLISSIKEVQRETYACHLCAFDADRITVLDRHLLNDHKIGLDNLLKLVMAKTKDGLSENEPHPEIFDIRQPYYKAQDEIREEGEFVIETVAPKIKILKHASTNTDIQWNDIPDLKDNCKMITGELEKFIKRPMEKGGENEFLAKMQTFNESMCKFVDSTNTLKKVLTHELGSKHSVREEHVIEEPYFELGLGDRQETPREWERASSDKMERNRHKSGSNRGDKTKYSSESFYF